MLKPLIVSHSDYQGGAARAAWRLHSAFVASEHHCRMLVGTKSSGDWRVHGPTGKIEEGFARARPTLDGLVARLQRSENPVLHSPAWLSGVPISALNNADHDVVNLHWTCAGLLSIERMAKITKPVVWTLHDMWAFCGSEHYSDESPGARWRVGYRGDNRGLGDGGLDIDRWAWNRKRSAWKVPWKIVTPSNWLANCVRDSALMRDWDVTVIPNSLDTTVFKPLEKKYARFVLNLPQEGEVVLFGAIGGGADPRKGWDLLEAALRRLSVRRPNLQGIIFGERAPQILPPSGLRLSWLGHLSDDVTLALLYSAADVMVVPSRQENLPQSATEAQACGCPVVAFNTTGLPDAVVHKETGFLAEGLSPENLSDGINWVLDDEDRRRLLSNNSRARAVNEWSERVVTNKYLRVFEEVVR